MDSETLKEDFVFDFFFVILAVQYKTYMIMIKLIHSCTVVLATAFLMGLSSCADKKYTLITEFPISETLEPVKVIKYDPVKINIYGINEKIGDYWRLSAKHDDYSIAITDKDFNPIAYTCREGNGPGEFLWGVPYGESVVKGDSVIINIKDMYKGTLNRAALSLSSGKTNIKKTGEIPVVNRALYRLSNGTTIVNNNENRYFLIGNDGDTTFFESWGDNIGFQEYEDWWCPVIQTHEIFTPDSLRMLVFTDRPYVWLHGTDGSLIRKVYVEKRPEEVMEDYGGLGFQSACVFGNHFLLMIRDLVDEETGECTTRLMLFDFDMSPEAVYNIPGDNNDFYADTDTGLVWILDSYNDELIQVFDLSEWL